MSHKHLKAVSRVSWFALLGIGVFLPVPVLAASPTTRPSGPYHLNERTQQQLADLIEGYGARGLSPAERIEDAAKRAIDTPYALNAPMFAHRQVDCVTLVEHLVAMGLADSWASYHYLIARLRYKDGILPLNRNAFSITDGRMVPRDPADEVMSLWNRNHFIILDWNRYNQWCFQDLTQELGSGDIKPWIPLHHIARTRELFAKRGLQVDLPDQKVVDAFIPSENVDEVISQIRPGDVIEVIRGTLENRYCNHMGVVIRETRWAGEWGDLYMVHASPPRVRRDPIRFFVQKSPVIQGFKVLRLRSDAVAVATGEASAMASRLYVPPPSSSE